MKKSTGMLVRLSHQLKQGIQRLARKNRRPQVEEARIAFENHVASSDSKSPKKS
jgi:predicted transcriptional regulator